MFLKKSSKHLVFSNNLPKTYESKVFFKSNLTTKFKCNFLKKDLTGISKNRHADSRLFITFRILGFVLQPTI